MKWWERQQKGATYRGGDLLISAAGLCSASGRAGAAGHVETLMSTQLPELDGRDSLPTAFSRSSGSEPFLSR